METHIFSATGPTSAPARCFISWAALLVKVMAKISKGETPVRIRWAMRDVRTRLARTRTGDDQERALVVHHRLSLDRVQALQELGIGGVRDIPATLPGPPTASPGRRCRAHPTRAGRMGHHLLDLGAAHHLAGPPVNPRKEQSPSRRAVKRTIFTVITLFVFYYVVIPTLAQSSANAPSSSGSIRSCSSWPSPSRSARCSATRS